MRGYDDLPDSETRSDGTAVQRTAAAECEQRKLLRIVPSFHGYGAYRAHHVGHYDIDATQSSFLERRANLRRNGGKCGPCLGDIQWQSTVEKACGIQSPKDEIRIGDRGLIASEPVACRAGPRTGAHRPDLHETVPVDPGD